MLNSGRLTAGFFLLIKKLWKKMSYLFLQGSFFLLEYKCFCLFLFEKVLLISFFLTLKERVIKSQKRGRVSVMWCGYNHKSYIYWCIRNKASDSCKTSNFLLLTPVDRNLERSIQKIVPFHQKKGIYSVLTSQESFGLQVLLVEDCSFFLFYIMVKSYFFLHSSECFVPSFFFALFIVGLRKKIKYLIGLKEICIV